MALQKRHIEHIKIWQASGLTQAVYCQQQGLNAKTFSRWFKTYQLSNQPTKPLLIAVELNNHRLKPVGSSNGLKVRIRVD